MHEQANPKRCPRQRNVLTPEQITLLHQLATGCDMTGDSLREASGFSLAVFNQATAGLWESKLLRGIAAQGCCNDPCGNACISANKPERVWGLTTLGKMVHQFKINTSQ